MTDAQSPSSCRGCAMSDQCALADDGDCVGVDGSPIPRGGRFVAGAVVVFLLPIFTAIVGAHLFANQWAKAENENEWQMYGLFVGLGVGILAGRLLIRVFRLHAATAADLGDSA